VQKCDVWWLLVIVAAAIVFTVFGLPYFSRYGYGLLGILVYFFLFVVFLYGRSNRLPKQDSPRQQLGREQ
jgi:uncharacterized membrane protein YkvI